MLFSFFICYQYVASRCVLGNFDLKLSNYNRCLQFRIETDIGVHALPVNKI